MKKIIIGILILILIGGAVWFFMRPKTDDQTVTSGDTSTQEMLTLAETYRDETYGFSIKYPQGFEVSTIPASDVSGDMVVIQDVSRDLGMQIAVSPFDELLSVLTADRIKQDVPDLVILEPQDVIIGNDGKGVAFFDGQGEDAVRQIWFVARGNLYQITAVKKFDATLREMMNTWVFE